MKLATALLLTTLVSACGADKPQGPKDAAQAVSAPGSDGTYRGCLYAPESKFAKQIAREQNATVPGAFCIRTSEGTIVLADKCREDGGLAMAQCPTSMVVKVCPHGPNLDIVYYQGWSPACE